MTQIQSDVLNSQNVCAKIDSSDYIMISRKDLETEHRQLLSRLHQIRRLLGYPSLMTGKQQRQGRIK